eukprot:1157256-Pelagomonas_calceolata.AAC.13
MWTRCNDTKGFFSDVGSRCNDTRLHRPGGGVACEIGGSDELQQHHAVAEESMLCKQTGAPLRVQLS